MQLKYIDSSRQKGWEDLTKKNPATGYMQSFWWTKFQNLLGWETYKIGIFNKDKLLGGAIVAKYPHYKNQSILYIPEGPVLPYEKPEAEEMFHLLMGEVDKIADFSGKKITSHLSIEPKLIKLPVYFSRFIKAPTDRQPLRTLIIDLNKSEEKILKEMKPKGRYNIKVAKKYKVEIIQTNLQTGLKDFLNIYLPFIKRSGFEGKDPSYFESLAYILSQSDQAKLFFAKYKEKILVCALVIYYGNTATFLFGASTNKDKQTMASYLLHWEIIQQAKKLGYHFYDWYGITPEENNSSHPWSGFTVFKNKFGGEIIKYIGAYNFIYNQKLYKEYLVLSKKSPE